MHRTALALVVLGLLGWGAWVQVQRASSGPSPAPAPPASVRSPDVEPVSIWRATPLDGHWTSGRYTLVVRGTALALWRGTPEHPWRHLAAYDAVHVAGDRVALRAVGRDRAVARYRWRVSGDTLRLRLVGHTGHDPGMELMTRPFTRG